MGPTQYTFELPGCSSFGAHLRPAFCVLVCVCPPNHPFCIPSLPQSSFQGQTMLDTKFACLKVCHRVKADLELVHIPSSHPPTNISDLPASTFQGLGFRHQPLHPAPVLPPVGFPGSGIMPVLECFALFNFLLLLFICCVGIIHLHMCAMEWMWRPEDNVQEPSLSSHQMDS